MMINRTIILDDLKERTLEEALRKIISKQEVLTLRLPEGEAITIQPLPRLKPLSALEAAVPQGWKDAIYE